MLKEYHTLVCLPDEQGIAQAAELLRTGELVAIPTETVYGLAANALDADAAAKIYRAKGRPQDNPLIVHIDSLEMLDGLVTEFPEAARRCAERFWPGPLTMVLPKSKKIPAATSGGLDTVGIRMPANETARKVIGAAGVPLAAPSANVSGRPSPTTAAHVFTDLAGRIPLIVDGGACAIGVESTVICFEGERVRILRPGFVSAEELAEVVPAVVIDSGVTEKLPEQARVRSPGMKYRHYSPRADVIIIDGQKDAFIRYVRAHAAEDNLCCLAPAAWQAALPCPVIDFGADAVQEANRLFDALRETDRRGFAKAYAVCPPKTGVGLAVYNRLLRAAGFHVVCVSEKRATKLPGCAVVGLTGQSGAGKTTVSRCFAEHGFGVIDADLVAREVTEDGSDCNRALAGEFPSAFREGYVLDRRALGRIVFGDREKLDRLEQMIYPFINTRITEKIRGFASSGRRFVLLDAPTLFEAGADRFCDCVVCVVADEEKRRERIFARDGLSDEEITKRFSSQKDAAFYTARAEFVIENNADTAALVEKSAAVEQKIRELFDEPREEKAQGSAAPADPGSADLSGQSADSQTGAEHII